MTGSTIANWPISACFSMAKLPDPITVYAH